MVSITLTLLMMVMWMMLKHMFMVDVVVARAVDDAVADAIG